MIVLVIPVLVYGYYSQSTFILSMLLQFVIYHTQTTPSSILVAIHIYKPGNRTFCVFQGEDKKTQIYYSFFNTFSLFMFGFLGGGATFVRGSVPAMYFLFSLSLSVFR